MARSMMRKPQNLHTHTVFCDGQDTPARMAEAAWQAGLGAIGFSGHAPLAGQCWCMAETDLPAYRAAVLAEKERWAGRLEVYLGLEQDLFSPPPAGSWDYRIGSVHGLLLDGELWAVDESPEAFARLADRCGGVRPLVREYYRLMTQLPARCGCDIIGHFDLVTKFNEGGRFFDPQQPTLRAYALEALEALAAESPVFEVNTGVISCGLRTNPYPDAFLLRALRQLGGRVCITGDSHAAGTLTSGFDRAVQLLQACGFTSHWYLGPEGFEEGPLPDLRAGN